MSRSRPARAPATSTTRALLRGLDVVEALADAEAGAMGPSAIGDVVALDKATVSRLLRTLVETGWVRQDAVTRQYRLSGKILRLAANVRLHLDLRTVARPHLRALLEDLGETVHLGVMEDLGVFYVDKLESPNSIQLVSRVGQVMPLHSTSLGKAILAALPEDEREAKIARMDFVPRTDRTITNAAAFRRELIRIQQRGYATDDRENEPLGACVAAAIIGPEGRPVGAVSVSGPHYRVHSHLEDFGEHARATAAAVALDLGASQEDVRLAPGAPR
jgi:DNA-binding IclR family transcriptional regulator